MRRFVPILVAGAAFIAAACRDTIAPKRSVGLNFFGAPVAFMQAVNPNVEVKTDTITLDPAGGHLKVGDFWLDYPANSVCDPATSAYGPEMWDQPCETLDTPITLVATYWWDGDLAFVDFAPDVRFAPDKEVFISTRRKVQSEADVPAYTMWYMATVDDVRYFINDASVDSDVVTRADFSDKRVYRRVKHFSGIALSSGMPCDETLGDPDCIADLLE